MSEDFDLDTLQCILEQFSKNVIVDCSKVIETLLKSQSELNLNKSLKSKDDKTFASIKILLNLYEKLDTNSKETVTELPVNVIVQSLKNVLHCSSKNCNLPVTEVQWDVLSTVCSLFKILILQNSSNQEELVQFYVHILKCLDTVGTCSWECLVFKLKVLNSVYHALTQVPHYKDEFIKKIQSINNVDECRLFANFVLHPSEYVAIQTLMYLIPEYVNCFKSEKVIEFTWKQISKTITHSSNEYLKVLTVLCNLFDICCNKSKAHDKVDLSYLLLEDVNYWKLIQSSLVEVHPLKRKQGMFLLKKTVDLLKSINRNFVCGADSIIFYWNSSCKDNLHKIYSDIIICLEFLEEQQVHIIIPIFQKLQTLGEEIIECENVDCYWAFLLYKKSLLHESSQIVKWGLTSFLKLSVKFFSNECIIRETVVLLVDTVSKMSLYYNNGLAVSKELSNFFNKIVGLNSSKLFFSSFIHEICYRVWSAEALFFVIHSLSGAEKFSSWGENEISDITVFVSKAFKTHNKIIRTGIQCELLKAITNFTHTELVALESVIILLSKLCLEELADSQALDDFCNWIRNSYSIHEAENVLKKYYKTKLEKNFNEKFVSVMLILFEEIFYSNVENSPALSRVHDISSSFSEMDKRPYCDKLLYNQYLSLLCCIYKTNNKNYTRFLKPTVPFIKYIMQYIQTQLQEISSLQDFNTCETFLNTFEILFKTLFICNIYGEVLNDFYMSILKDTEAYLHSSLSVTSIGIYWRIKLLSIILDIYSPELKSSFWDTYLLSQVNKSLMKDDSKQTRDLQTLWGKINSEFIEGKWIILKHLIKKKLTEAPLNADKPSVIGSDTVIKLSLEALNCGGYGVLCPVMAVLRDLLPAFEVSSEVRKLVDSIWKAIMERRKTEEFKVFIKHFVEFLYQEVFILKGTSAQEILFHYADLLFSDFSLTVINIFMKHIQQINLLKCSLPLFCHVIGKGLIFGPMQQKDERLTNQVCSHIEFFRISKTREIGDYDTGKEIRARAVQIILTLNPASTTDQTAARSLIKTLRKMEVEINKNRTRYFDNSHVHRVKHRLMQSLLLLEPMLNPNEADAQELSSWLYHCLMTENSQPSVRYLQEWLLVRMLLRHPDLYPQYCITNYKKDFEDNGKRSLCSAIAVSYHLCKLSPSGLLEDRIMMTMNEIFSWCFYQHFEVRLYAQVVFHKLYDFAQNRNLEKVTDKFHYINVSLASVFETHLKGNYGKNLEKMLKDFYFSKFNPLEHFSLETIYTDLPRLLNVESDEWISTETFLGCGIKASEVKTPIENADCFADYFPPEKRRPMDNISPAELPDKKTKNAEAVGNFQKKIIPQKPLIPEWDENSIGRKDDRRKDGLIVVASLIDRIPNLGGLARTCEIFGASEFVLSSYKYTEVIEFTSLSVTAEKWITIREVKVQNLQDYISEMKLRGYTVIGAEQMLHSIPLSSAKFPKKSLLLLGNEKEGIPPNLLPLLDVCIEIPQLGVIRSLNVHVTGALFIWEYVKQNHFS